MDQEHQAGLAQFPGHRQGGRRHQAGPHERLFTIDFGATALQAGQATLGAGVLDALILPLLDRQMAEISPIERGVMWLGAYELQHCPEVPWRVVLNEYIELAKEFGGTDGHKYVNAVLNGLGAQLRSLEVEADRRSGKARPAASAQVVDT